MLYRVKGALLIGIFLTSIISWPRTTSVTYFPHTEAGDAAFDFFKQVVTFWPLKHVGNALEVRHLLSLSPHDSASLADVDMPVFSTTMVMGGSGTRLSRSFTLTFSVSIFVTFFS